MPCYNRNTNGEVRHRFGFVGIGYMGRPIARRLLESGFKLTAYDRDHSKAEELIQYGGTVAQSVSEISSSCNVVLSCLPSDEAVLDIYAGPDGVFANAHEEISVGFWPGSGTVAEPAFYAYARPEPQGFASSEIRPAAAYYSRELADFILPYEMVRSASSPDDMVLDFYQSAYSAGAFSLAGIARRSTDRRRSGCEPAARPFPGITHGKRVA